jgi:hypothetical protein
MEKLKHFLKNYWFDTKRGLIWLSIIALVGGGIAYFTREKEKSALNECKMECVRTDKEYATPITVWQHAPTVKGLGAQEGYFSTQKECLDYCIGLKTKPEKLEEYKKKEEAKRKEEIEMMKILREMKFPNPRDECKKKCVARKSEIGLQEWVYTPSGEHFLSLSDCLDYCSQMWLKGY